MAIRSSHRNKSSVCRGCSSSSDAVAKAVLALLANGDHSATGWVLLVLAVVPFGDILIVLGHRGRRGTAYGVHGVTALLLVVSAGLWLLG